MNYAYITVLTSESYLGGVLVLSRSLQIVQSKYPLYVLLPSDSDPMLKNVLENYNIPTLFSDPLSDDMMRRESNSQSYWRDTLFKLKVFQLTQFDKIICLDSDMLVINNIDHLFQKKHMSCVAAGRVLHHDWIHLNSGIMIIEPSNAAYDGLLRLVDPVCTNLINQGVGFGDQDIISARYDEEWTSNPELQLPESYNCMLGYAGLLKKAGIVQSAGDIFVYHFTGRQKPWRNLLSEDAAILIKILKRSKSHSALDYQIFYRYKQVLRFCLKQID